MKTLIHYSSTHGVVGAWRVAADGKREAAYVPGRSAAALRGRAESFLDLKGEKTSWEDWLTAIANRTPYGDDQYFLVDSLDGEAVVDTLDRLRHEAAGL